VLREAHTAVEAARGKRRTQRSQRLRSKDRKRGGQVGRKGSGLTPAAARIGIGLRPGRCRRTVGSDLSDGTDVGMSWR
jgi:hypothetical protein